MAKALAYHRPDTTEEALELLAGANRVVLAGGTRLNDRTRGLPGDPPEDEVEVVDIQALGLDGIQAADGGRLTIGATPTLQALVDDDRVPPLLRELARAELPNTLRNTATIGGTFTAADGDSPLHAGLLVHGAEAERNGPLVTALVLSTDGSGSWARTGRTPADTPIVAAVARRHTDGATHLALTGVADTPVLVDPDDPTAGLDPPGDFRGSTAYRLELARILSRRALEGVA